MSILKISAYISLLVQVLTGFVDLYALQLKIPSWARLLHQLLQIELGVQIVEGIFYTWLVLSIGHVSNITPYRYHDWFFTTPSMLFTLMAYLTYLKYQEDYKHTPSLMEFWTKYWDIIVVVFLLNGLMLLFGYLGEIKVLNMNIAVMLGFIPFVTYYYIIYDKFIKDNKSEIAPRIYWYFVAFWSLYGIAALMPYIWKNTAYNILDLFAKNFFGLFLAYLVWKLYNANNVNMITRNK